MMTCIAVINNNESTPVLIWPVTTACPRCYMWISHFNNSVASKLKIKGRWCCVTYYPLRHTEDPEPGDIIKTCSFRPTLCGAASAERELLANQETKATK